MLTNRVNAFYSTLQQLQHFTAFYSNYSIKYYSHDLSITLSFIANLHFYIFVTKYVAINIVKFKRHLFL